MPFSCGNDGKGKFWRKTQKVSRNWLQKKCSQPMSPLSIEGREREDVGREKRRRAAPKREEKGGLALKGHVTGLGGPYLSKASSFWDQM
jgi:hypothetical protein